MIREGIARGLLLVRRAGEEAFDQCAYGQAAQYFEHALTLLDPAESGGDARAELLLLLARAAVRAGDVERTAQAVRDAAAEARRLSSVVLLAQAALARHSFPDAAAAHPERLELLEEALAALGASESALRARVQSDLARALLLSGARERGEALSRSAVALARRLHDPPTLAFTLAGRRARHVV